MSTSNKRYMCLNLYGEKHDVASLGMISVTGSMPAEEALKLIDGRLQYFGLDRKHHVVGAVMVGTSTMKKKLLKNMEIEHQLYHAPGSHSFSDLLYKAPS